MIIAILLNQLLNFCSQVHPTNSLLMFQAKVHTATGNNLLIGRALLIGAGKHLLLLIRQLWQTALAMCRAASDMQTSLPHGLLTHPTMVGGCSGV